MSSSLAPPLTTRPASSTSEHGSGGETRPITMSASFQSLEAKLPEPDTKSLTKSLEELMQSLRTMCKALFRRSLYLSLLDASPVPPCNHCKSVLLKVERGRPISCGNLLDGRHTVSSSYELTNDAVTASTSSKSRKLTSQLVLMAKQSEAVESCFQSGAVHKLR